MLHAPLNVHVVMMPNVLSVSSADCDLPCSHCSSMWRELHRAPVIPFSELYIKYRSSHVLQLVLFCFIFCRRCDDVCPNSRDLTSEAEVSFLQVPS